MDQARPPFFARPDERHDGTRRNRDFVTPLGLEGTSPDKGHMQSNQLTLYADFDESQILGTE